MLNQGDYQAAFGQPDPAFTRKVSRTVSELTRREEPVMRRKLRVSLVVAALIAILLAAVAFAAATKWGVLDFFKLYDQPIHPMASAKGMISSNLGSDGNDKLRMTVREAVYDGRNVRAMIEIAPAEGSNLLLVDPWTSQELDSGDGAGDAYREKAKTSGKTLYTPDTLFLFDTRNLPGEGQNLSALSYDDLKFFNSLADSLSEGYLCVPEGDALVYSLTSEVKDRSNELTLTAALPVFGDKTLVVPFILTKTGGEKAWKLVPERAELDDAGCTLLLGELHLTPLAGYIDVCFKLKPRTLAAVIDGQTTVYATKNGLYYHLFEHCSGMENANAMTVNEALAKGKKECPVCLTGDRTYSSLNFELMDARGNAIGLERFWAKQPEEENPDSDEIFRMRGLFQPFDQAQAEYFLLPFDSETGERFSPVRCEAQLQMAEEEPDWDVEW